jgi:hypothetical protein
MAKRQRPAAMNSTGSTRATRWGCPARIFSSLPNLLRGPSFEGLRHLHLLRASCRSS